MEEKKRNEGEEAYKNKLLFNGGKNPDVLECLSNLSSDEVFTPIKIANDMLDLLPQEIFKDKNSKILDPACKSGVFLREAAKRFINGLIDEIPDLQERINWIMKNCLYGIATTELCALMSRRTLYCTKDASGPYSICPGIFDRDWGNIYYDKNQKHTFKEYDMTNDLKIFEETTGKEVDHKDIENEKVYSTNTCRICTYIKDDGTVKYIKETDSCKYCGASAKEYGPFGKHGESYAYWFIHQENLQEKIDEIFGGENMKFTAVIGNPPYQLGTTSEEKNTNSQAKPLYNKFVELANELNPKYITMIIPSRWMTGGMGLTEFREMMLTDKKISHVRDFLNAKDCFPTVEIKGGVQYFLRDDNYSSDKLYYNGNLKDRKFFSIRDSFGPQILNKILSINSDLDTNNFSNILSQQSPFGVLGLENSESIAADGLVICYGQYNNKSTYRYISKDLITNNTDDIDCEKILVPIVVGNGRIETDKVNAFKIKTGVCSRTYMYIKEKKNLDNILTYMNGKFFHYLLGLHKNTQHSSRAEFKYIPIQDWSKPWTDEELYKKYNLTQDEIDYIENLVWSERKKTNEIF